MQGGKKVTRKVFLVLLALVLTLSVGLAACGGAGEEEEEEEEETYDLTIASTAGGSVTTPGEETSNYDEGTMVNLVATPDACYHFINWTGDVGTIADVNGATTTITMNGDYDITANFEEEAVAFADPNLEEAVRVAIGIPNAPIYESDLDGLTSLSVSGRNITDLTGLECTTSLTWLGLWDNQISDISPLANLTSLTELYLGLIR
jgi:Leucine-rich repeat (LRR) protein